MAPSRTGHYPGATTLDGTPAERSAAAQCPMTIKGYFEAVSCWLDCVAATFVAALGRIMSPRNVRLVEENGDPFAVEDRRAPPAERVRIAGGHVVGPLPEQVATSLRGSRLELVLRAELILVPPA